jgi:hypothetical protein
VKASFAHLRPVVEDEQSVELVRFYDGFEGAISSFVLTELYIRQGERCKALNVFPSYQTHSTQRGEKHNVRGLSYLDSSRAFLNDFRSTIQKDTPVDKKFLKQALTEFKQDLKEALADLEIKASDATELGNTVDEVGAVFVPGATSIEVFNFIDAKVGELEKARQLPGRGADTNLPIWKLIAAAVLLGLGAWVVYKCFYSRSRCSKKEKAIYDTILATAIVAIAACE